MAKAFGPHIRVTGDRELRRALNRIDKGLGRRLKDELRDKVAEPIASRIRAKVPVQSGRWRDRIRAGATTRGAHVDWGRTYTQGSTRLTSIPYAAPVEFGGYPPGRPFIKDGRYVWPTAREHDPVLERATAEAYDTVVRMAGFL